MPRAYIEMILSSKPGKRRWYFAISCGSKRARRSRLSAFDDDRYSAETKRFHTGENGSSLVFVSEGWSHFWFTSNDVSC
jgi:hypothetical protein